MNKWAVVAGAAVILLALLAYSINFNEWSGFSVDESKWGAFGDFVGGFSNPILTFITTCLLIQSLDFQRAANKSLIEQGDRAKDLAARQRIIDDLRSFESTFFSLAAVAREEFERLKITSRNKHYEKAQAVDFVEEIILSYARHAVARGVSPNFKKIFDLLDARSNMAVFSCVRSFYVLFKFARESAPDGYEDRYIKICTHMMPVKMLNLICLARAFQDWAVLDYLSANGFFEIEGVCTYLDAWRSLSK